MKATNIIWDDNNGEHDLPDEVEIPRYVENESLDDENDEVIYSFLFDEFGCEAVEFDLID